MESVQLVFEAVVQVKNIANRLQTHLEQQKENSEKLKSIRQLFEEYTDFLRTCEDAVKGNQLQFDSLWLQAQADHVNGIKKVAEETVKRLKELETKYYPRSKTSTIHQDSSISGSFSLSQKFKRWVLAHRTAERLAEVEKFVTIGKSLHGIPHVFNPYFFRLRNCERAVLDFSSPYRVDGKLKSALLHPAAYGLFGYGSSCWADAVRKEFDPSDLISTYDGGVHFMSFGTEITEDNVIAAIKEIISAHIRESQPLVKSVKEAAEMAESVLPQKPCLFFCDDLWSNATGEKYFDDLKILVRHHPNSRIVVTTRYSERAKYAGCKVFNNAYGVRADLESHQNSSANIKTCAIVGPGGVGKTVSMMGIAGQSDIRARFRGGIFFMSFGQEATTDDVVAELEKILIDSNGVQHAQKLDAYKSAKENATTAAKWFQGRPCLFLCDDLWGTESDAGFFPDLRILTNGHPDSRMVVTTRDSNIAHQAGYVISASSLPPLSSESKAIFFKHACIKSRPRDAEFASNLEQLLLRCRGLPLLLSVVGRRLAEEDSTGGIPVHLRNEAGTIEDSEPDVDESLGNALMRNLQFLKRKVCEDVAAAAQTNGNAKQEKAAEGYSVEQMFRSLSIIRKQAWIPVSVLGKLWRTNAAKYVSLFNRFQLISVECRTWQCPSSNEKREEDGVMLHDMTLDICRKEANKHGEQAFWHAALLETYVESGPKTMSFKACKSMFTIGGKHRQWYTAGILEDGYIHSNLPRHLVYAGMQSELWSLLLSPKWSKLWIDFGTSLPLQRSLNSLDDSAKALRNTEQKCLISDKDMENIAELKLTYRALQCAWGRIQQNPREYPYQMLGRLHDARSSMHVVHFFLKEVEANAERPFLKPQYQCFEDPRSGPEMEIHLEDLCSSVQCLPQSKHVIAAVGCEIHEIDVRDGSVLQRFVGHTSRVRNVAVMSAGSLIASADDATIRVWDKGRGSPSVKVLDCDNPMSSVHGSLAVRDFDTGPQIFATVMQGVKAWNVDSWLEYACELPTGIDFIAFSADGRRLICASAESRTVSIRNMDRTNGNGDFLKCPSEFGDISCLAVSADGKSIACGTRDGEVCIWDPSAEESQCSVLSDGSKGDITLALAMTSDANLLFSGSKSGDVRVWDLGNRSRAGALLGRHASWVASLAISPDDTRLFSASRDKTIRIWDLRKDIFANDGRQNPHCHTGPVTCISSSPDGRFIISGSEDRTVRVWDAKTGKPIGDPLAGHDAYVTDVAVSKDSDMIYSKSEGRVCCWDSKTFERKMLHLFAKSEEASGEDCSISLVQREDKVVECLYKSGDRSYTLAKMPAQKNDLQWHIDHERKTVYVGLKNGAIIHLKVES